MKSDITLILLALIFVLMAAMEKTVPPKVKSTFNKMYPEITEVEWSEDETGNFLAFFTESKQEKTAHFKKDGVWLKTIVNIELAELPDCITDYINSEFDNAELLSAITYEDPKVKNQYRAVISIGDEILEDESEETEEDEWEEEEIEIEPEYYTLSFNQCTFVEKVAADY